MPYTYRLFDSIADVDPSEWQRVGSQCGEPLSMDPRFVAAVEVGMKQSCRFWHVVIYDDANAPVACASLSAMELDLANLADPGLASIIRRLPGLLSRLRNLKVLMCGLPPSVAQKALTLTSPADSGPILAVLDGVISRLAADTGMHVIVYKEFDTADLEWAAPLLERGYRRIPTPPMHFFRPEFPDFQHYYDALKSNYRKRIRRSQEKFERMGITTAVLSDPADILKLYTPDVHRLYLQMVDNSDFKFEVLSIDFFREMARRFDGKVDLIVLSQDSRVAAFAWCVQVGSAYHLLFGGMNYKLNEEADLYFNLIYAGIDVALRKGVSTIAIGQTADSFKAWLGCRSEPMFAFVRGVGPVMGLFIRYGAGFLVARTPVIAPADIFKQGLTPKRDMPAS